MNIPKLHQLQKHSLVEGKEIPSNLLTWIKALKLWDRAKKRSAAHEAALNDVVSRCVEPRGIAMAGGTYRRNIGWNQIPCNQPREQRDYKGLDKYRATADGPF